MSKGVEIITVDEDKRKSLQMRMSAHINYLIDSAHKRVGDAMLYKIQVYN